MAASRNLSSQQFHVYRGIHDVTSLDEVGKQLGMHWTDTPEVARQFATRTGEIGTYGGYRGGEGDAGIVVHAVAHKRQIQRDPEILEDTGARAADQDEREIPLKYGEKVQVRSVTTHDVNTSKRSRKRFRPPLEMEV